MPPVVLETGCDHNFERISYDSVNKCAVTQCHPSVQHRVLSGRKTNHFKDQELPRPANDTYTSFRCGRE